VVGRAN